MTKACTFRVLLRSVAVATTLAGTALASSFKVTPIQVYLSGKTSSALVTLSNESTETLRFQVSSFGWNQSPAGDVQLTPTDDIVVFPTILSLKAGEERNVRIGTTAPVGAMEKTYRVFFEELPPLEKPQQTAGASEVRLLTKMGIPVFLEPPKPAPQPRLANVAIASGRIRFTVENTGNSHFSAQKITVTGYGAGGDTTFARQLTGWYVLAGGVRDFDLEFPKDDCAKTRSVVIEAQTEQTTIKTREQIPAGACSP
jgi:fimbrial chaperone protein